MGMLPEDLTLRSPDGVEVAFGDYTTNSGGDVSGYVLDGWRNNPPSLTTYIEDLPQVAGSVVVVGRPQHRTLEIQGTILAETEQDLVALRNDLVHLCRDRFGTPITASWTPPGESKRTLELLPAERAVEWYDEDRLRLRLGFTLRFIAPDPVAYLAGTTSVTITGTESSPQTVENVGTASAWPTIVGKVGGSGTVNTVKVGNVTVGRHVTLENLGADPGYIIEIVMEPGYEEVTVNGVSAYAKRNAASRWWSLEPGDNDIYAEVKSGTATVSWKASWRPGFID